MADRSTAEIDLVPLLGERDAQLVAQAIFALQRERVAAFKSAKLTAALHGTKPPDEGMFALDEVPALARRLKAAPVVV